MPKKPTKRPHPGRGGHKLSMHGVTPEAALAAFLKISPADVKKIKEEEAKGKRKGK